jgi:hypothetical protein
MPLDQDGKNVANGGDIEEPTCSEEPPCCEKEVEKQIEGEQASFRHLASPSGDIPAPLIYMTGWKLNLMRLW